MAKQGIAKKSFFQENKGLLLILLVGFTICIIPSIAFNLPVVQTDGASYFNYAKIYAETGDFNAPNPEWNKIDALEERVSDYPPFFAVTMGLLIRYTGNDIFWMNGFYLGIFFLLANIFLYLLVLELTKKYKYSKWITLLTVLFSIFNVRAYYTIFTGQFPAFLGFCFTIPVLYFTTMYLYHKKSKYIAWTIAFTLLAGLSYMQQLIYIIILQLFIFLGYLAEQRLQISWPAINFNVKNIQCRDFRKLWYLIVPSAIILAGIVYKFAFGASGRASFIQGWINDLMQPVAGYQAVWQKFFITDGPILVLFGIIGLIWLIYKNDWKTSSLLIGGLSIVVAGSLFFAGEPFTKVYVYRFYVMFYLMIAISAAVIFAELLDNKKVKCIFKVLLILCIIIQVIKLSIFCSMIGPAISVEEYQASMSLLKDNDAKVLYIHDGNDGTFNSFKWIVVYVRSNDYDILKSVPSDISNYKYVYVVNKEKLQKDELDALSSHNTIFNGQKVQVYSVV